MNHTIARAFQINKMDNDQFEQLHKAEHVAGRPFSSYEIWVRFSLSRTGSVPELTEDRIAHVVMGIHNQMFKVGLEKTDYDYLDIIHAVDLEIRDRKMDFQFEKEKSNIIGKVGKHAKKKEVEETPAANFEHWNS